MTALPVSEVSVSVVIVSRGRPDALLRCLLAVSQLQFDPFEVVIVADPAGVSAVKASVFVEQVKLVGFDEANISRARNLGITHAGGDVIAFIDDDAVPEPTWLHHLIAPAQQSDVVAMGGFVRARNGISFQYKAQRLDGFGAAHRVDVHETQATVLHAPHEQGVKTEGTNMAFRREVLIALGGFDPAFAYFLDETDLNMRLAAAGHATAIVPLAEVHHGFAANAMRTTARVPTDLFEIGASWAVFQRKHIPTVDHKAHWAGQRQAQRARLFRHMQAGTMEPRTVRALMLRLDSGYDEGLKRAIGVHKLATHPIQAFCRFPAKLRDSIVITSRSWRRKNAQKQAAVAVLEGKIATLMAFSPSSLYHHVQFNSDGVWVQTGGQFGKSVRKAPVFSPFTLNQRVQHEMKRIRYRRGLFEFDRQTS